jgi:hypothetical protein
LHEKVENLALALRRSPQPELFAAAAVLLPRGEWPSFSTSYSSIFFEESLDRIFGAMSCRMSMNKQLLTAIYRVSTPAGIQVARVMIVEGCDTTLREEALCDGVGRDFHFGQNDHFRVYGEDFRERRKSPSATIGAALGLS